MKKFPKKIEAVIFDMDGVLVDTMRYHVLAWQLACKRLGIRISGPEVYAREGEKYEVSGRDFLMKRYKNPTKSQIRDIIKVRKGILKKIVKPRLFPGVRSLVSILYKKELKLALVTGTLCKEVSKLLPKDVLSKINVVISGESVTRGKPHPDPYLCALRNLKVSHRCAIVIENAPYGVKSAKKAGIFTIALTTSLPRGRLKGSDIILKSIPEVSKLLKKRILE